MAPEKPQRRPGSHQLEAIIARADAEQRRGLMLALILAALHDLDTPTDPTETAGPRQDRWLSPKEAAARLGVSTKWLSRRKRSLPFIRSLEPDGHGFRVSEGELVRFMARRR